MHPTIQREIMKGRTADFHRQAERDRATRAAEKARQAPGERGRHLVTGHTAWVLARRVLRVLGIRSPSPAP